MLQSKVHETYISDCWKLHCIKEISICRAEVQEIHEIIQTLVPRTFEYNQESIMGFRLAVKAARHQMMIHLIL